MKKILRILLLLVVLAALIFGAYWGYKQYSSANTTVRYNTETIVRADIASTISATGTVEPEELVNVGAQVTGKIISFGIDTNGKNIDYGSQVKAGAVLAKIDDATYAAEVKSAKAAQQQAEAAILSAQANIKQAGAKVKLAKSNWERAQRLYPQKAIAESEFDNARSEYYAETAAVQVAEASLAQANAQLATAEAALDKAQRNLDYCTISSPVDGVIIDRRVSIGQTVVSSMSASSIFLIAKDLRRMQVWVSVNEADIGNIKVGMPVTFTVDAFPDRTFKGEVYKIRLNATMSQNVVTYVVEVATDNSEGILLPYLTANVKFIKESRQQVLTVPNAAIRYIPNASYIRPEYQAALAEANELRGSKQRIVWIRDNDELRPEKIEIGLNDGIVSEVKSGNLTEGMEIVTGASVVSTKDSAAKNTNAGSPFLPKPPPRRNNKSNPAGASK